MTKFFMPRYSRVAPRPGETYVFTGESAKTKSNPGPFMVVQVFAGGSMVTGSEERFHIGWTPLEGPQKGLIYKFSEEEEIMSTLDWRYDR